MDMGTEPPRRTGSLLTVGLEVWHISVSLSSLFYVPVLQQKHFPAISRITPFLCQLTWQIYCYRKVLYYTGKAMHHTGRWCRRIIIRKDLQKALLLKCLLAARQLKHLFLFKKPHVYDVFCNPQLV